MRLYLNLVILLEHLLGLLVFVSEKSIHFVYFFLYRKENYMNEIKEYTEKMFEILNVLMKMGVSFGMREN